MEKKRAAETKTTSQGHLDKCRKKLRSEETKAKKQSKKEDKARLQRQVEELRKQIEGSTSEDESGSEEEDKSDSPSEPGSDAEEDSQCPEDVEAEVNEDQKQKQKKIVNVYRRRALTKYLREGPPDPFLLDWLRRREQRRLLFQHPLCRPGLHRFGHASRLEQ